MKHQKIGLVLDGGGGKGAYQIGVWRAMRDYGLDQQISAIAGTSVGGLNAALIINGDLEKAFQIWSEEIAKIHLTRLQTDLEAIMDNCIDFSIFKKTAIDCFLATYSKGQRGEYREMDALEKSVEKYVNGEMTYYNLRVLSEKTCHILFQTCSTPKAVLLATSALPVLCRRVLINGKEHRDGGVPWGGDNSPVYPLTWKESDCDLLIDIHLDQSKRVNKTLYPDITILEIIPQVSSDELGVLNGTLNFNPSHAKKLMEAGYRDGRAVFQQFMKNQSLAKQEKLTVNEHELLEQERKQLPGELIQYYREIMKP